MKIAAITKPSNGCDFYRIILPMEYMPWAENDTVKFFYDKTVDLSRANPETADYITNLKNFEPDIIFFNRNILNVDFNFVQEFKKKGTKIVVDVDDYWELGPSHPLYGPWYQHNMNHLIMMNLAVADVVFATNEQLRQKVLKFNKNCVVIPNAVPFGETSYSRQSERTVDGKMNFIYAGGSTYYPDVAILKNKFDRLGGDKWTKDRAIFTLAGFDPIKEERHCQWDKMSSVFQRAGSYQILNTRPLEKHMTFYDEADVVLIPLVHNEFNTCKSILKVVEASTRELPCIVSSTLPYTELKGFPGLMWDNWIDNIKYCIKNPEVIKDQGRMLAEKMKEVYHLPIWSKTRYQIFKHLTDK